jgi:hypothetical protein
VLARTGDITSSYELAREYGFTDYDGRRPDLGSHMAKMGWMKEPLRHHIEWLERLSNRAKRYAGDEQPARDEASAVAR